MASFDFRSLPEEQQLAFYGLLLSMAQADGNTQAEELGLVLQAMELDAISPEGRIQVRDWLLQPPQIEDCLEVLARGSQPLRYGVVMHLTDVVLADEEYELSEKLAMRRVREALDITREQGLAIEEFVWEVRRIRDENLEDDEQVERVKTAALSLSAVGVPGAALYFSGSLIGLGAKGLLGALAAVGMTAGVLPGIGLFITLGATGWLTASYLLDKGNHRKRARVKKELVERRERMRRNVTQLLEGLEGETAEKLRQLL